MVWMKDLASTQKQANMKLITSLGTIALLLQTSIASAQTPTLVRDFFPGGIGPTILNSGLPNSFRIHNDRLLLFANEGDGLGKLFALDDLSGNMEELAHVGGPAGYTTTNGGIITSGDNIYFFTPNVYDYSLYVVRNGAVEMLGTFPGAIVFYFAAIPLPGGKLLFPGHSEANGHEPWVTDGTVAGTHMVKDIMPGASTSLGDPFPLFQGFDFQGRAYFLGQDESNGMQLWVSDGTEAGTTQFAVVNDPGETGAITLEWSKNDDHFIITTPEGVLASDGTTTELMHPASTVFVKIPGLTYSVSPEGWMYFIVSQNGARLYRTKGTVATTVAVLDANVPLQVYPYLTELNGMLYAFATTGGVNTSLLRLDPVTGQATTVKAFAPITNSSGSNQNFYGFRVVGAHFYFFGIEGDSHRQYWRSDGTEAGTVMISNFQPNAVNGGPNPSNANMIAFDGHFVFAANSEEVGVELFATEGVVGISESTISTSSINAWVDGSGTLVVRGSEQLGAVSILDATGREVARKDNVRSEQVQIPINGLSAGLYLVRSEYKGKVGLVKVLLER